MMVGVIDSDGTWLGLALGLGLGLGLLGVIDSDGKPGYSTRRILQPVVEQIVGEPGSSA